jgi:hypothetical protein
VREFQLALLDRMYEEAPEQSEAALRSLGATRADAAEAGRRRLRMGTHYGDGSTTRFFGWGSTDYLAVLGDPVSRESHDGRRGQGAGGWPVLRWDLPLWPDLWFEVLETPDGFAFDCRLTRKAGLLPPQMGTVEDLKPWSCVYEEVEQRFGPMEHVDGMGPVWTSAFTAPDAAGRPTRYAADFTWGLLQGVRVDDRA